MTNVTLTVPLASKDTRSTMPIKQDSSPREGALSSLKTDKPRRERRLHIAIPIKVYPSATSGSQLCCTYDISTSGARLVAPQDVRDVGQIISLQRQGLRASYKVVWIGKPGTPRAGQIGVVSLNPRSVIWENELTIRLKERA